MDNLMHKSDLNTYCQRISIPLPVYKTTFEGDCCHALRFACTVSVGGKSFTSPSTFTNRKSAEQDAAKLALQHLLNEDEARTANLRVYLRKLVCQDKARCKMLLNEFVNKIKMECTYETVQVDKSPLFVSSLELNGTCYKGEVGKNKKEAEQLAALAAILSLLDDPAYATPVSEVIKSKFNVSAVFNELKEFPNTSVTSNEFKATTSNSVVMPLTQEALLIGKSSFKVLVDEKTPTLVDLQANGIEKQEGSEILVNENKHVLVNSQTENLHADSIEEQGGSGILVSENKHVLVNSQTENLHADSIEEQGGSGILVSEDKHVLQTSLPQTEKQGVLDDTGHLPGAVTISRCSYVPLPITSPLVSELQHHESKLPEATQPASQQITFPIEIVPVPAAAQHNPGNDAISSKKRRMKNKKKKKANKRLPITSPLISEPQQHEIKLPEATHPFSQQIGVPTEFVHVQAVAHNPGDDSISSRKRRKKNKKKANKRLRADNKPTGLQ